MVRKSGRSAADTKRRILDATLELLGQRGTVVSLEEIAAHAGVSKGGLLYHYPHKDALLQGIVADFIDEFRAKVSCAMQQEPEGTPGRVARAYLEVSFAYAADPAKIREYATLAAQLLAYPELEEMSRADALQWREALFNDGLDPEVVRILIAASDGVVASPQLGAVLDAADFKQLHNGLRALTFQ